MIIVRKGKQKDVVNELIKELNLEDKLEDFIAIYYPDIEKDTGDYFNTLVYFLVGSLIYGGEINFVNIKNKLNYEFTLGKRKFMFFKKQGDYQLVEIKEKGKSFVKYTKEEAYNGQAIHIDLTEEEYIEILNDLDLDVNPYKEYKKRRKSCKY